MEDRRAAPRQAAFISASLETSQGRSAIAITRDISTRGLLLLTRPALQVGELVKLTVALGATQHTLSGKVVRVEAMEPHELWRHKVAIAVDESDPALSQLHAALEHARR
ncbi:MAG: PilZ domain-containing protein [Deltaproteobacteria bacterium]|nr:MAG: PilZ domain-containing protein [Deltaproteobacteria bacterium]